MIFKNCVNFQNAFNSIDNIIFVKNENFDIVYANEAFLSLYAPEERDNVIGKSTFDNFSKEEVEGFIKEDQLALAGEKTEIIEQVTDYQGEERTFLTKKSGFISEKGDKYMVGVGVDVSLMVEQEKHLVQKNAFLEKFLPIAAHDLRSPIGAMISSMMLLEMDHDTTLSPEASALLSNMQESAKTMLGQVVALIEMHKGSENKDYEICDMAEVISMVEFNLKHSISDNNVKLLTNILPPINAKKEHMIQLFQNLVENSIKYKSKEAPLIMIKSNLTKDAVSFTVEDNGIGVKAGTDPFALMSQGEVSYSGGGIGLTLCKKVVEYYRGSIEIDPNYKNGTRVIIILPQVVSSQENIGLNTSEI